MIDPRIEPLLIRWLHALDQAEMTALLERRPDVTDGAPVQDLADLADRLVEPWGALQAIGYLPLPAVQVLEVLAAAGDGASIARAIAVLRPQECSPAEAVRVADGVNAAVDALIGVGLIWPGGDRHKSPLDPTAPLIVSPGVRAVIPSPLGLGRCVRDLAGQTNSPTLQRITRRWGLDVVKRKADLVDAVATQLGSPDSVWRIADSAPVTVLETLLDIADDRARAGGGPIHRRVNEFAVGNLYIDDMWMSAHFGARPGIPRVAATWAWENGLALASSEMSINALEDALPSEVLLALLGTEFTPPFDSVQPPLATVQVDAGRTHNAASAAVMDALAVIMAVYEYVAGHPIALLKSGGVGSRELARVTKATGVSALDLRLALELGDWIGLLTGVDGVLDVSPAFEEWRRTAPAERVVDLFAAWVSCPITATVDRDEDGRAIPALTRGGGQPDLTRLLLLGALHDLPDGLGIADPTLLGAALTWRTPLAPTSAEALVATWAEAERLGVIVQGRLSGLGATLLEGDQEAAVEAARVLLPESGGGMLLGGDLTVVVPGHPEADTVDLLNAVADRESHGTVSMWRLSADSVRRALDDGWMLDDIRSSLRAAAGADIPQPMEYLLADVGRRHGRIVVRPAVAVVVSEDEALLAEIGVHRALRPLGLRRVAPTVLVATEEPARVLEGLRAAGYMPAEADSDGEPVIRVGRPGGGERRSRLGAGVGPVRNVRPQVSTVTMADILPGAVQGESDAELARRLLRGDPAPPGTIIGREPVELVLAIHEAAPGLSVRQVRLLALAATDAAPVWIRYRANSGSVTERIVSDVEISAGLVYGWCHLRDAERVFKLSGLLDVRPTPVR